MPFTADQLAYLQTLPPPDPNWKGLGGVPLPDDPRDYSILLHPGVAEALAAGPPQAVDLSAKVGGIYDQGAEGACVAYSTAGLCSLDEALAGNQWPWLDAENLYRRNGGQGSNGVDSRQVLQDVVDHGVNRRDGGAPVKEKSYLFVPKQTGVFKDTLMAALAAGKPCVLATLLPTNFGWSSSGTPTQGYHQLLVCGGDDQWCIVCNSWGASWGNNGFGRLPWSYLDPTRWDVFAYTVDPLGVVPTPTPTPQPQPNPQPAPTPGPTPTPVVYRTVTGQVQSGDALAVGQTGSLSVATVGFTGDFQITQVSDQPSPQPNPQPQPTPGSLQLTALARQLGGYLGVWCSVCDSSGQFVAAQVSGTVGSTLLPARSSTAAGVPATWMVPGAAGVPLQLVAQATDGTGRTGSLSTTVSAEGG